MFYSLQGEGFNSGRPAFFVRLGGCDVRCPWCDTKESWERSAFPVKSVSEITSIITRTPARAVVVTGGEPTLHNLDELCNSLKENDLEIFLETSGTHPISGKFDWIALSPKKHRKPLPENYKHASELKVVITSPDDFAWAEENSRLVRSDCRLFLQPEWSRSEEILPVIFEYILNNPRWNISIQLHKYLNIK